MFRTEWVNKFSEMEKTTQNKTFNIEDLLDVEGIHITGKQHPNLQVMSDFQCTSLHR